MSRRTFIDEDTLILLLADGRTYGEIARELDVHANTVNTSAHRVRRKHKARNNCHLIALAYHKGLLLIPSHAT